MDKRIVLNKATDVEPDLQFERMLREAEAGIPHAQNWDTGDTLTNIMCVVVPLLIPFIFAKFPHAIVGILGTIAGKGIEYLVSAKLADERQTGISLLLGSALGFAALVVKTALL